jgi:GDPmannose 4,6-dehydratase
LRIAFAAIGIDDWQRFVRTDERFMRPAEVDQLVGDSSKAAESLGWKPTVEFPRLIEEMVRADIELERSKTNMS